VSASTHSTESTNSPTLFVIFTVPISNLMLKFGHFSNDMA